MASEVKVHGLVTFFVWLDGLSTLPYLFEHQIGRDDRVGVAHQVAEQAVGPVAILVLSTRFLVEHPLDPSQVEDCSSQAVTHALPLHSLLVTKR